MLLLYISKTETIGVRTMTQKMIDSVFADPKFRKKFSHPRKDKAICEMRLAGAYYADIAKRYGVSSFYCREVIRRVVRLYTVFMSS